MPFAIGVCSLWESMVAQPVVMTEVCLSENVLYLTWEGGKAPCTIHRN